MRELPNRDGVGVRRGRCRHLDELAGCVSLELWGIRAHEGTWLQRGFLGLQEVVDRASVQSRLVSIELFQVRIAHEASIEIGPGLVSPETIQRFLACAVLFDLPEGKVPHRLVAGRR